MTSTGWTAEGRPLLPGTARGAALVLREPLSFWGGVDPATGRIVDVHHPAHGESVAGRVLVMRRGRGSSSSSTVLAECLGAGTGPVAIVLGEPDRILLLGSMVAEELGLARCPVLVVGDALLRIRDGDAVELAAGGRMSVGPSG